MMPWITGVTLAAQHLAGDEAVTDHRGARPEGAVKVHPAVGGLIVFLVSVLDPSHSLDVAGGVGG